MNESTQQLIVTTISIIAGLSLIEVLILSVFVSADVTVILAVMNIPTTAVGILGGFLTGKTLTEKQSEELGKAVEKDFEDIEQL